MDAFMIKLFNMSINAVWLILAVIVLRVILKKAPKYINLIMWGLVGLRLVCPFTFESVLSLIPSSEPIPSDIYTEIIPHVDTGIDSVNQVVNSVISTARATPISEEIDYIDCLEAFLELSPLVWVSGIVLLLIYSFVCFFILRRKVKVCMRYEDNVYFCDNIKTPFILGIFRPKIYLLSDINANEINSVIAHEKAHITRFDHIWKPLGFAVLCVHWFNPFVWVAYNIFCRDIEFACDEKVLKTMGTDEKKSYSETLLSLSSPKYKLSASPLAFGETGIKGRIKSVLSYKKPALWIIIASAVVVGVVSVVFMTNPVNLFTDGIYYVDEYYYIVPGYSETVELRNSALDYGLDKTYYEINNEWISKTNLNGTFGNNLLIKCTEKEKAKEIEMVFEKLPEDLTHRRIRDVYATHSELFIIFSNGIRIGAYLPKNDDGNPTVMSVFRLSGEPHETLPITDIDPDYLRKDAFTNNEDVEISVVEVELGNSPFIEIIIQNYTDEDLIFEYPDTVYLYENGKLIDCDMIENRKENTGNFYTAERFIGAQKRFSLEGYDFSKTGTYHMIFNYRLSESKTEYSAGISFEVVSGMWENASSEMKGEG